MKYAVRKILYLFVLLAVSGLFLVPASLQAQSSNGAIQGRVVDASGGGVPGVTLTATNVDTGVSRVVVSGTDGVYRFPSLPVGSYNVSAELSGFGSVNTQNVRVNISTERTLDVTIKPAAVSESITVTAETPLIADSAAIGTVVSQEELEGLPLNGRQFANLASLAPGTSLAYNADPTKPGQLTVALNGGIGRNVNYVVDGGDNTDDTIGGALQNYNLEAVQEFKIQTQSYKAEYGRSSGGVLTVVTKTGTNRFGGSVYGFFRDDSLNEKTEGERRAGAEKSAYERQQYGGSLGGPIVRDRAHFFATYEKTDRPSNYVIDTSSPSGVIYPAFQGTAVAIPFNDELITAKATSNITPAQFLQLRYGYQKNSDKYGAGPQSLPSSLGTLTNKYESILGGHSWTVGSAAVNEFVYQWTRFDNAITADSDDPFLIYPNGVTVGQNINTPQTTLQEKSQFKDDFSWSTTLGGRRNDFKTGFNYVHEPILGGTFTTGKAGQYTLLENRVGSPVTEIVITGGNAQFSTPIDQYGVYFQDDLALNDRLTINAGVRYDFWEGFDLDQSSNPILKTLSSQTTYKDSSIYDGFSGWDGKLENDTDNISPRLGFTYDLTGASRHILRGGVGRYYDFPYTNATLLFPAESVQSNFGIAYTNSNPTGIRNSNGTFFQPGQPLPPNQLPAAQVDPPNNVGHPSISNSPYSDQVSLGYSTQVSEWLGLTFDLSSIRYNDIPFRFRANGRLDAAGAPQASRRFSNFGNFRIWYGEGEAKYEGANLGFKARMNNRFEMQGFYTLSKAEGNVLAGADEFRLTNVAHQPDRGSRRDQSINFREPNCGDCFAPLDTDARHRVTLSALYNAPFAINVSGILRYRSALPYTQFAGTDLNRDGFNSDVAPGRSLNDRRGSSFSQIDMRLSREFKFTENFGFELIGEVFNLLNEENPAGFVSNGTPTTFAGDPLQGEQRLAQLGLRLRY